MRYANGGPDAHDYLIDRPEGLTQPAEPKITISVPCRPGQDDDLTSYGMQAPDAVRAHAAARDIEDSPEYLAAEQDADYQVQQLERDALQQGTSYLLGLSVSMIAKTYEMAPEVFRSVYGEHADGMIAEVLAVHNALPNWRRASRIIIEQHAARNSSWLHARNHYANWRERFYAERGVKTGRA